MSKGIFITGTGTDVGKTYVSALIVKKLRKNNINAGYYKPALSGAYVKNGEIIPGDAQYVCEIANLTDSHKNIVPYVFKTSVSPHLAAQIENKHIDKDIILNTYNKISEKYDFMVVEGCGGIICPLRIDDEKIMLTDIIKMLNLDIIIVASSGLGTINSTVLTVKYAKQLGIKVRGIILNNYNQNDYLHEDNRQQIEKLSGVPVIACINKNATDIKVSLQLLNM